MQENLDDGEEGVKKETGKEKGTLENDKRVKVKYAEIRNSFANDIQKGERKIKARKGDSLNTH